MLVAHAASTCDVCLEGYHEDFSYHSIPCGHVFCLPCLMSMSPTKCPLCRHDFSAHSLRKVHLALPSARDIAARSLELKLVQSSPEMTLSESLLLFQEVQELLEKEAQDDFLVLRAFAAVLCGFHETKDKLAQTEARAQKNEAVLLQSLEEARSARNVDEVENKAKYEAAISELAALRTECAELRAEAEQARLRSAELQVLYAQAQTYAQSLSEPEYKPSVRKISNPLPTPPRPIEIPFLKLIETLPLPQSQSDKGKTKDIAEKKGSIVEADPMTSVFIPTLSASITTEHSSTSDVRSEVTTLVFKPPKRMPVWDSPNTSYTRTDIPSVPPLHSSDSSPRLGTYSEDDHVRDHSYANERPKGEKSHAPSNLNFAWSEDITSRHINRSGQINLSTDTISRHPQTQCHLSLSEANIKRERSPRFNQPATLQPTLYASSPHATSYSVLPVASGSKSRRSTERRNIAQHYNLRRASSPVVMLLDAEMRTPNKDIPTTFPPHENWRHGSARIVPALATTGDANAESDMTVDERHPRLCAPSSLRGQIKSEPDGESRSPRLRTENVHPSRREAIEFPPSLETMGEHGTLHIHRVHGNSTFHGHSRSLAANNIDEIPNRSPTPVRGRAYSHSHLYPASAIPVNDHDVGGALSLRRRLTLDASSARLDSAFHISVDQNGPRAMPVGKV